MDRQTEEIGYVGLSATVGRTLLPGWRRR